MQPLGLICSWIKANSPTCVQKPEYNHAEIHFQPLTLLTAAVCDLDRGHELSLVQVFNYI